MSFFPIEGRKAGMGMGFFPKTGKSGQGQGKTSPHPRLRPGIESRPRPHSHWGRGFPTSLSSLPTAIPRCNVCWP